MLTWLTTGIRPRQWVAVHRKHHAYTDAPEDPHSPVQLGFWRVQLTNVVLYRKVARDDANTAKYARDLPPDRWDRTLFDHAALGLGLGIALLCAVFGWEVGLLAAAIHAVSYLALNAAINAAGHTFGRKNYANTAFNNLWRAWVTAGEGLHNNHHGAPTSARLAHAAREWDPAWWVIRAMVATRAATLRVSRRKITEESPV